MIGTKEEENMANQDKISKFSLFMFEETYKQNSTENDISKVLKDVENLSLLDMGFESSQTDMKQSYIVYQRNESIIPYFKPKKGSISNRENNSFEFSYFANKTLYLFIVDQSFQTLFVSPSLTVNSYIQLEKSEMSAAIIYLKVTYV